MGQVTDQKLTKVEYLLSPSCSLRCSFCKLADKKWGESLSIDQVKESIDVIYNDLGAKFIAFYGREILELGDKYLCELFEYLKKYQEMGKGYTIITNGIGLDGERISKFMQSGLDSITCSVDAIGKDLGDIHLKIKSNTGLKVLAKARSLGIRDTCGIITITHKSLPYVKDTITLLSSLGIWSSLDIVHYKKGEYNLSPKIEEIPELALRITDLAELRDLVDWIEFTRKDKRVFQTPGVLRHLKTSEVLDLNWKCVDDTYNYPTSLTVGADGKLSCCDNYFHPELEKYSIFDCKDKWEEIKEVYVKCARECKGCEWLTHIQARESFQNVELLEKFIHK